MTRKLGRYIHQVTIEVGMKQHVSLMLQGKFQEALSAFRSDMVSPSAFDNGNLALILLNTNEPREAIPLLEEAASDNSDAAGSWAILGTAYWVIGEVEKAEQAWQRGSDCKYVDLGGIQIPSLLYYFGVKTSQPKVASRWQKMLQKAAASSTDSFSSALARYILGESDSRAILKAAKYKNADTQTRQECRVFFWTGLRKSLDAPAEPAEFRKCVALTGPAILEIERYLALYELGFYAV
jgi:tetratricopeptide (TPR) repeat protein